MVWFHGGGYQFGLSTSPTYDPTPLVGLANDMIFVSANYRVGAYGFLATGKGKLGSLPAKPHTFTSCPPKLASAFCCDSIQN